MNSITYTTVLEVINDRKSALIMELQKATTDKRSKGKEKNSNKSVEVFARINECDKFLELIKTKIDVTAESELRDKFKDLEDDRNFDQNFEAVKSKYGNFSHPGTIPGSGRERLTEDALGRKATSPENDRADAPVLDTIAG